MKMNHALSLALIAGLWPVMHFLAISIFDNQEDERGIIALVLVMILGWLTNKKHLHEVSRPETKGLVLLVFFLTCYWAAWIYLPMTAAIGFGMMALWWGTIGRYQPKGGRFASVLLLLLSLPIAHELDFYAGFPLRLAATQISAYLVWPMYGMVETMGSTLVIAGTAIEVDTPCSGLRMLWVGMVVSLANAVHRLFGIGRTLIALSLSLIVVVAANALRSTVLALAEVRGHPFSDTAHELAGLLIFGGALVVILFIGTREKLA